MKKFLGISQAVFALAFAALFFAACEATPGYDRVTNLWLEGSKDGYVISDSLYSGEYKKSGYIHTEYRRGIPYVTLSKEKEGASAEFKITGFNLRIEMYEGETLPGNQYLYVFSEKDEYFIGMIRITTIDDKPKFTLINDYDDLF